MLAFLLAICIAAQPGTTDLHPRLRLDDRVFYRVKQATELSWEEATVDRPEVTRRAASVTLDADVRLTVLGTTADGGAVVSMVFEHIVLSQSIDGATPSSTTVRKAGAGADGDSPPPATGATPATEGSAAASVAEALASAILRFDLAPDGSVSLLTGLEPAWQVGATLGPEGERLLGPFSAASARGTLGALLCIDSAAPGVSRRVGESWPVLERATGPAFGTLVQQTIWTLGAVEGSVAELAGRTDFVLRPPSEHEAAAPAVSIKSASGSATARWDAAAGVLLRREDRREIATEAVLKGVQTRRASAATASSVRELLRIDGPRTE